MMTYKLVLADDHHFLVEGILSILKDMSQVEVAAVAKNGFELMEMVAAVAPHLILMDLNMPGYDGLQCLKKIKEKYPAIKVMILTSYTQPELIEEIKKLQADGYLAKGSSAAQLKEAIEKILAGKKYFPAMVHNHSPGSPFFMDGFLKKYSITRREVDIIRLICNEMSTKEMAAILFLSELTINTHRRNILKKLDVKNVAGLVNFAKENKMI